MEARIINKTPDYKVAGIRNAQIVGRPGSPWRKFAGVQSDNGIKHQFTVEIDEQYVQMLKDFNLNVGWYEKEGYRGFYYLTVTLSWKFKDPNVFTVAYNGVRTKESEVTIGDLDQNDNLQYVNMEVAPSHYNSHGREGYTAYANNVYIYLGAPSFSEQIYLEQYGDQAAVPAQASFIPAEDEDIPF